MVAPPSLLHDEDEGEDEDPFLSDDEKKEMDLTSPTFCLDGSSNSEEKFSCRTLGEGEPMCIGRPCCNSLSNGMRIRALNKNQDQ